MYLTIKEAREMTGTDKDNAELARLIGLLSRECDEYCGLNFGTDFPEIPATVKLVISELIKLTEEAAENGGYFGEISENWDGEFSWSRGAYTKNLTPAQIRLQILSLLDIFKKKRQGNVRARLI